MRQYLDFLRHILKKGEARRDRTGVGTQSVFSYQMRFDLNEGFPLVTTKKVHVRSIIHELFWFLQGQTNIRYLHDNQVSIWDEWADDNGDLGPVYGKQWRAWQASDGSNIDQISAVMNAIRHDPHSRRLIVSAWNVGDLPHMRLQPCHILFQFYVHNKRLSCCLYQRSADAFLGVPFNIASYALLTHLMAAQCDLDVGEFIWTGGDCHIYQNHIEQVELQLSREPHPMPKLILARRPDSIDDYVYDDIIITDYVCHPGIKAPVAV